MTPSRLRNSATMSLRMLFLVELQVGHTALWIHPLRIHRIARQEAELTKVVLANVAKSVGRVGWNDDDAPGLVLGGRLIGKGALAFAFEAYDDFFHVVQMGRYLGARLEHVLV